VSQKQGEHCVLHAEPQAKSTWEPPLVDANGSGLPESWNCIDCGFDTAPAVLGRKTLERAMANSLKEDGAVTNHITNESEVYMVKRAVWKAAKMEGMGGCLCIGCLEKRIGRTLTPNDFPPNHVFNKKYPGSVRLVSRWTGVSEEVVAKLRAIGKEPVRPQ
jgi:succinyl-CoA synthetase alpha subunit